MTIESWLETYQRELPMKYLCFLSVVGAVLLHPWEPSVWRAGGLLVIAIIWGHVPGCCFTPCWAHHHG